ncbi:hypothetical protein M9Y10_001613 [Tritrichomonas musculus]|uniref:Guanylate cyclase domain-containing protein n=1 Tax=Tritrichomonas musculus TaxID=1915356 RepID=A0ABR2LAH6_9EUKA
MKDSTNSGNEVEDLNFVIRDLQYSTILNVPFYTQILHHFFSFFGKINASVSAPAFFGYIYYIILIIQSFLPAFLVDCEDLWPRGSLMSMVLYVLGYLYQGPHASIKSARVPMSFVISIVFIVLLIVLIVRSQKFQKTGRASSTETKFFYYTFKYMMPLFCPHLMSGVTISFDEIINQNKYGLNIITIILAILTFAIYLYLFHVVISPRVLLEDTPSHEWFPLLSVASISNTTLLSIVSGIAGCINSKKKAGCSIWMLIQSLAIGFLFFYMNGIIKAIIGVVSSATAFAAGFTSLILLIDIFISKPLSPEILFVASVLIYVALIIIFKFIKQSMATKVLLFLDSLIDSNESSRDKLETKYTKPFQFLSDIRSVIETWHPYIATFEIFDFAISKWSDNFSVLLFYSRILAMFPSKNQQMMIVASMIANLPEKNTRNSYLYQFRHLARTRQTSMTRVIRDKLEEINSKTEISMTLLRRFWENILQKNIVNFWSDTDHVISQVSDLDSLFAQLLDDYPNNYQLLKTYYEFVDNIKKDHFESNEISKKLAILKQNGQVKSDLALEIALQVFPLLNNYIQLFENQQSLKMNDYSFTRTATESATEDEEINPPTNDANDERSSRLFNSEESKDESNYQLEVSLSEMTKRSKLGSIWIECIILVIMTILSIVLFYIFINYYSNKFAEKQGKALNFLLNVEMLVYDINFFTVNLNILPLVLDNETYTPIAILNRTEFTENVAPTLFSNNTIPEFALSTEIMIELLSQVKDRFSSMVNSLAQLDKGDPIVQQINHMFYEEKINGYSLKDLSNNQIITFQEILSFKSIKEFFTRDGIFSSLKNSNLLIFQQYSTLSSLSYSYASTTFDQDLVGLQEKMILVVLATLLLITLPYLIQLYLLIIQSESIAESFTQLPNTEIRSIINKFGKSSSEMEEDISQIAILSNIRKQNRLNSALIVLIFLISFITICVCSIYTYFTAQDFVKDAESISTEISTLTPAFATLSLAFSQALRCYMLSHDGNFFHVINLEDNFYTCGNDNLEELSNSTLSILFLANSQFSSKTWSKDGGMGAFYKNQDAYDYFDDVFPYKDDDYAHQKTFFEELASHLLTESIDMITSFMNFYTCNFMDMAQNIQSSFFYMAGDVPEFPGLIYWFSNFSQINRTQIFFELVQEEALSRTMHYKATGYICFYIVIAWQIVACILMILYLLNRHNKIKKSLYFYHFVKPEIILQNQNVMKLIETGRQTSEEVHTTFSNTDYILQKLSQGIAITEKNLVITMANHSFAQMINYSDSDLQGQILTNVIDQDIQDKSFTQFLSHIEESLSGKYKGQFTENISILLKNGQTAHFSCTVTCLTTNGIANEGDYDRINRICFLFDDNTEVYMREQLINREKKHLDGMLSNVMPSRVVQSFVNSGECISFIVQSVTIGSVRVRVMKKFDENPADEYVFYNEIFSCFDEEIKEFELLSKVTTFAHTYSYIGGLFSEVNKPERHAEESIKFALKLLKLAPELSKKYDTEIHLTIGVHTGGPIVAGVMSFGKPTFQIIGTVSEMANQLKNKGVCDHICISRAVYELIFSVGLNVQEQGDITIRGGKVIPTYLVHL